MVAPQRLEFHGPPFLSYQDGIFVRSSLDGVVRDTSEAEMHRRNRGPSNHERQLPCHGTSSLHSAAPPRYRAPTPIKPRDIETMASQQWASHIRRRFLRHAASSFSLAPPIHGRGVKRREPGRPGCPCRPNSAVRLRRTAPPARSHSPIGDPDRPRAGDAYRTGAAVRARYSFSAEQSWEGSATAFGRSRRPPPLLLPWRTTRPISGRRTPVTIALAPRGSPRDRGCAEWDRAPSSTETIAFSGAPAIDARSKGNDVIVRGGVRGAIGLPRARRGHRDGAWPQSSASVGGE